MVPPSVSAEARYFCAPPRPLEASSWQVDLDVNGSPDLEISYADGSLAVLPFLGNSLLATNRSYFTNIDTFPDPVIVAFPDEVASLASGNLISFFNPSSPFWHIGQHIDEQPILLPMPAPANEAGATVTNFFAVKLASPGGAFLAWVRIRLTSAPQAVCALDWGVESRAIHDVVVGSRPAPSTIRSKEKALDFTLFEDFSIDVDDDGTKDISYGGSAVATSGMASSPTIKVIFGNTNIFAPGTSRIISNTIISYYLGATGEDEILRDNLGISVLQPGAGIGDFTRSGDYWAGGSVRLVSLSIGGVVVWDGPLAAATNGYMGFRLRRNDDFFYGWIRLHLNQNSLDTPFGPSIQGWAIETRPQVPIVAGASGVAGNLVLDMRVPVGNLITVNATGLTRSNVTLSSSEDLSQWMPLVTNSLPFKLVYPGYPSSKTLYFRAAVEP